jgi:hypothetical protein
MAARNVARAMLDGFDATMIVSAENRGLAQSIIAGVSALCEKYGRVIVVEDDLLVSPRFLSYMNSSLDRYADDERVMQVSGYMFPIGRPAPSSFFLPLPTSWGWGTWQRAWAAFDADARGLGVLRKNRELRREFGLRGAYPYFAMLEKQQAGKVDSWAIRWYLSVFLHHGLVLYPGESLVDNAGFDGTGANCGSSGASLFSGTRLAQARHLDHIRMPNDVKIDEATFDKIRGYLRRARMRAWIAGVFRTFTAGRCMVERGST